MGRKVRIKRYAIARPIEGISLNGNEFLCDKDNKRLEFTSKQGAVDYLNKQTNSFLDEEGWDNTGILIWDITDEEVKV